MEIRTVSLRPQEEVVQALNELLPESPRGATDASTHDAFRMELEDAENLARAVAELRREGESMAPHDLRIRLGDALGQCSTAYWKSISPDDLLARVTT